MGSSMPAMPAMVEPQPAVALSTFPALTKPRLVSAPCIRPSSTRSPVTSVSWWISTPRRSASRAYPQTTASWRMIPPGGGTGCLDGVPGVVAQVQVRAEAGDLVGPDQPRVDPLELVDLGPSPHGAHRGVAVGQGQMPPLAEHHVEVQFAGHLLVELDALIVETHPLGGEVVAADDGGVAAAAPGADIALVEHGHIGDPVIFGQIIGAGQPMRPAADDHHLVLVAQGYLPPHPGRRAPAERLANQRNGHLRILPAPARRRGDAPGAGSRDTGVPRRCLWGRGRGQDRWAGTGEA